VHGPKGRKFGQLPLNFLGKCPVNWEWSDQRPLRASARTAMATHAATPRCRGRCSLASTFTSPPKAVHDLAQARLPEISLATVYNT